MSTSLLLLSMFLIVSTSLAVEHCKCQTQTESDELDKLLTTEAPEKPKEEYKVTATEDGQKVEQKIIIDKKKQTETIHVPSFKNLDEADIIHDFKSNLTMYRLPERKRCFLGPLDSNVSPPRKLSKDLQQKSTDGKPEETKKSESKWEVSGEVKDRSSLSDEMANLCAKYPIYRIEPAKSTMAVSKVRTKRGCWYCSHVCYRYRRCILRCSIFGCRTHCYYYIRCHRIVCCN